MREAIGADAAARLMAEGAAMIEEQAVEAALALWRSGVVKGDGAAYGCCASGQG